MRAIALLLLIFLSACTENIEPPAVTLDTVEGCEQPEWGERCQWNESCAVCYDTGAASGNAVFLIRDSGACSWSILEKGQGNALYSRLQRDPYCHDSGRLREEWARDGVQEVGF